MGEKVEEFLRRIKEGIPVDEAPALLQAVQEEQARERAPEKNPHKFNDPRTQKFSDLWFLQRETATVEQKDRVGLAYISKVLGLGSEVARRFARGDREANHQVGIKQSGVPLKTGTSAFWQEMREVFPDVYTDEDAVLLTSEHGIFAVSHFIWQLEISFAETSPVLHDLSINAHAYK